MKPHHEEYFSSDKEVIKVEECNKMIKTPFSTKGTQWHKDDTNCKRNEVIYVYIILLSLVVWEFELDTCLLSLIMQDWENLSQGEGLWKLVQINCSLFLG